MSSTGQGLGSESDFYDLSDLVDLLDEDEDEGAFAGLPVVPEPPVLVGPPPPAHEVIAWMVRTIVERFQPLQIILFGSRARGTAGARSDVDLLVVFSELSDPRATAIAIGSSLYCSTLPKDIIVATPGHIAEEQEFRGSVLDNATREGIVLYDRRDPEAQDARLVALRASGS